MDIGASLNAVAGAALDMAAKIMGNGPTGGKFVVNHDNVLAAAKIIHTQVETFRLATRDAFHDLHVDPPGEDIVSKRLANAWNDKLMLDDDSYAVRIDEYVRSLNKLVSQLIESAKAYGHNEEEIAAALQGDTRA
ncbi:hypothetical protein [Alloactinosynnema sp. L-07]|uniref:hypothetical protein n=1 Tax=Alloactinosynnema sp. L-07 TaxID=1653480 RepID=UPI00065EF505|nr:hypothetical protein [Alloactinosynnema sp. L-07]CRK60470.1 hypothetical protein [Alloactinosynnema sp. L-07]